MLKAVKKLFNESKEPEMAQPEQVAQATALPVEAVLQEGEPSSLRSVAELTAVQGQLAEMAAQFDVLNIQFKQVVEQRDALLAQAKQQKDAFRMEAIKTSVGDARADAVFAATEQLDDVAFKAIVDAMATNVDVEAKGVMFKDVGVSAEVDVTKIPTEVESEEMKILKKRYSKK